MKDRKRDRQKGEKAVNGYGRTSERGEGGGEGGRVQTDHGGLDSLRQIMLLVWGKHTHTYTFTHSEP